MRDTSDMELVREYVRLNSETAFTELVQRHVNLVYSVALRHTEIAAEAEEITQAVFIILARKAASLRPDTILERWLYETTRLAALSFMRGERRRRFREQEAYMQSSLQESNDQSAWNQLAPLLDEAMSRLNKKDRDAVILRFFKDKSVCEVAAAMQVSEPAVQRRVLRALEKLRNFFAKRGVSSTTAIIAGTISANSVQAAPVALAKSVTAVAIVKGGTASASTLTLIKGALKIMAWTKMKTTVIAGAAVILAAGTTTTLIIQHQSQKSPASARYSTPEATLKSYEWALSKGDAKAVLNCFTPEDQKVVKAALQNMPDTVRAGWFPQKEDEIKGSHIASKKVISADEVELTFSNPKYKEPPVRLKKLGDEWKFTGLAKQSNN